MNLDEILDYLTCHGKPSLVRMNDGDWLCWLDLFVPGTGFSAKVTGDNKSKTALEAARSCKQRLDTMLQAMAEAKPTLGSKGAA